MKNWKLINVKGQKITIRTESEEDLPVAFSTDGDEPTIVINAFVVVDRDMIDREALLKALYCRKTIPEDPEIQDCENCPYYQDEEEWQDCDTIRIFSEAYELLDDQEVEE